MTIITILCSRSLGLIYLLGQVYTLSNCSPLPSPQDLDPGNWCRNLGRTEFSNRSPLVCSPPYEYIQVSCLMDPPRTLSDGPHALSLRENAGRNWIKQRKKSWLTFIASQIQRVQTGQRLIAALIWEEKLPEMGNPRYLKRKILCI